MNRIEKIRNKLISYRNAEESEGIRQKISSSCVVDSEYLLSEIATFEQAMIIKPGVSGVGRATDVPIKGGMGMLTGNVGDPLPRDLYELKKAEAQLFERKFILARDSLIHIHGELLGGNIYSNTELVKLLERVETHLEALGVTK